MNISLCYGSDKEASETAEGVLWRTIGLDIHEKRQTKACLVRFLKRDRCLYDFDGPIQFFKEEQHLEITIVNAVRGQAWSGEKFGLNNDYIVLDQSNKFDREDAQRGWDIAKGVIASALYSVVILDELLTVIDKGLIEIDDVMKTLSLNSNRNIQIIISGNKANSKLVEIAKLNSEFRRKPITGVLALQQKIKGNEIYKSSINFYPNVLGRAVQRIGRGITKDKSHRVLVLQWLKDRNKSYPEDYVFAVLKKAYPHLVDHLRSGSGAICIKGQQKLADYEEAERAWEVAKAAIPSGLYKTVILENLNQVVDLELLNEASIRKTLLKKPGDTEIIITGSCTKDLSYFDLASVHTDIIHNIRESEEKVETSTFTRFFKCIKKIFNEEDLL